MVLVEEFSVLVLNLVLSLAACRVVIFVPVVMSRASWSYSYVHHGCVVSSSGGDARSSRL
jgi:hypothetical protein